MCKYLLIVALSAIVALGCSSSSPTIPDEGVSPAVKAQSEALVPYYLWGQWKFFINAAHDEVVVEPQRNLSFYLEPTGFHLNALKFLESYCTNCLQVTGIKKNGDGTIDLTVKITHPFPSHPEYTGFDVKGIIMFTGSHKIITGKPGPSLSIPDPTLLSWRELGDPQVLNADGYVRRWSLSYNSGSDLPILNYWKGKYATGEPTADVNAYLNFYSKEERHIFTSTSSISKTYKIWVPPGKPIIAGYAVEACWEPPTKTPVTDPAKDFPSSANQPEPYYVKWIVNNGEPIKFKSDCCQGNGDCSDMRIEIKQWDGVTSSYHWYFRDKPSYVGGGIWPCEPAQDGIFSPQSPFYASYDESPGKYQYLIPSVEAHWPDYCVKDCYDILEFEVIE